MRTNLPEPWLTLRAKYRTIGNLCKMMSIPRKNFYNWIHGQRYPDQSAQKLLNLFLEAHGFPPMTFTRTEKKDV